MTPTNEDRVLALLVRVGAERRAASRARPLGTPGRAAEPMWTLDYLHGEANRGRARMSKRGLRKALDALVATGRVEVGGRGGTRRGGVAWGLPARWDGWGG